MKYSLSRNGQVVGSYTIEELRSYLQEGRVVPNDYVLPEGGTQWLTVAQVLAPPATGSASPAVTSGTAPPPPVVPPKPPSYLVTSILVTLFCCLPLGIAAIVFSAQVDSKHARGDYAGAVAASKRAVLFSWISFGLGVVAMGVYFLAMAMGAIGSIPR
jgi:hypothetical protein